MGWTVNRFEPVGRPQDYLTYRIVAPESFMRKAACAEVACEAYLHGWATTVPADGAQAAYIRLHSGRRFVESPEWELEVDPETDIARTVVTGNAVFVFEAGQTCFATHKVRTRPPLYVVRNGDWRHSEPFRTHSGPDPWADDFQTHEAQLAHDRE